MDTATHIAIGVGLTALATTDPTLSEHFAASATVIITGSLIPDIDTVLKLKNNATYITHHRGITHSIPFTLLWPLLITFITYIFVSGVPPLQIWMWAQLSVALHVFVDIFNSYGTQALRPFSNKWIQLSVINTFDPIIFIILLTAIVLWSLGGQAYLVFGSVVMILIAYYILRFVMRNWLKKQALNQVQHLGRPTKVFVAPTIRFMQWRIAIQTETYDYVGRSYGRNIVFSDKVKRQPLPDIDMMEPVRTDPNVRAFLNFSSIYRWHIEYIDDETIELRLIDLRYLKNGHYQFVAIVHLDKDLHVLHSFTGWVFSEDKLMKKLYAH
ncbi:MULTISPECIES: metal-dependent hydrolase [unclassified Staphylococcus]|uniref:metal-dependent hydrolase n=1 Tax=unclassified Staphylococcus TaxID=91994 RepID=UPI0021CE5BD9|nr:MULTISPECIES: metal-dependent hydrolase [unclassified Staphylococcus]UXR77721.1 metal-dependent hydrolase [Staphylococcus sp. IVB6227]UXR81876.1 metal-dependent hydrolase [Staphylococcus sp. IVB6214]